MDVAPKIDEPLLGIQTAKLNTENWPIVVETYKTGRYREALYTLLDYIDPGLRKRTGNPEQNEFIIPHGSTVARLSVGEDAMSISLPFLGLPEKGAVVVMRQVAELNFSSMTLAQIVLNGDTLTFHYDSPLELCEPWKTYSAFSEICLTADAHDDLFVEKFGARRLSDMKVEPFTSEQKERSHQKFVEYLQEGLAYIDYFEGKRFTGSAWDMACIALMKIQLFMWPQGYMSSMIDRAGSNLYGSQPFPERVAQARRAFQDLLSYPKEKFNECLYTPSFFIPPRKKSDLPYVQQVLTDTRDTAKTEISNQDFIGATLGLLQGIMRLEKNGIVDSQVSSMNWEALKQAGGKPWKEAAQILFHNVEKIMAIKTEGGEQ